MMSSEMENLIEAEKSIKNGKSIRVASAEHHVKRSTLHDFVKKRKNDETVVPKKVGGQPVIPEQDEKKVVMVLDSLADWGFPLGFWEIRLMVKALLDGQGVVSKWKDNYPGKDWTYSFRKRHNLSARMASNIKRARAEMSVETVNEFFNEFANFCGEDIRPVDVELRMLLIRRRQLYL